MKRIIQPSGLILIVILILHSCTPEFDAPVEELDLAITTYDKEANFSQLSTFYIADTIIYIDDDGVTIQREDNATEQLILDEIRQNLLDLGWEEVSDTTNDDVQADVAILVSVLQADLYYYYTYWWDWYYWYPWDWWYPGYPSYPWYPSYPSYPSYGYTIGSLIIDMINMKDVILPPVEDNPSIRPPIVWSGIVNGILAGSEENIQSRLTKQIKQVFVQSEALYKGTTN
jgi:hypothetical protein